MKTIISGTKVSFYHLFKIYIIYFMNEAPHDTYILSKILEYDLEYV